MFANYKSLLCLSASSVMLFGCSGSVEAVGPANGTPQSTQSAQVDGMGGDRERRQNEGMGGGMAPYNPLPIDMTPLSSQAEIDRCAEVQASVDAAGFSDKVSVTCGGGNAYVESNTVPDHPILTGIVRTNEQTVTPVEGFAEIIQLTPELTGTPLTRDASLAVAVNGVPIYDYTGGGEMSDEMLAAHQPRHDTFQTQQLDICGGHAGRADDYHYHVTPNCMIDMMANKDSPDAIIGWGFDGFPIFRDTKPDGSAIAAGELDVCNGMADDKFGYRYHTSESAPYIIQCLMGKVENIDRFPKVTPPHLAGDPTSGKEAGFPPRGGVEDFTFTRLDSGVNSLDYTYQGETYYIRYSASDTPNCYNYVEKTVTRNGEIHEGEYCRD